MKIRISNDSHREMKIGAIMTILALYAEGTEDYESTVESLNRIPCEIEGDLPTPYYGIYVRPKYNILDVRSI